MREAPPRFFRRLWSFPKPLIAAVNGAALAGGCGIATLCDFTLAVPEATFGYTEVRVGFIPRLVSHVPGTPGRRKIGAPSLLTGRILDAKEAYAIAAWSRVWCRAESTAGGSKRIGRHPDCE